MAADGIFNWCRRACGGLNAGTITVQLCQRRCRWRQMVLATESAGLWGENNRGTIAASYASGAADGGDGGNDHVGGLVGSAYVVARSRPAMPRAMPIAVMVMVTLSAGLWVCNRARLRPAMPQAMSMAAMALAIELAGLWASVAARSQPVMALARRWEEKYRLTRWIAPTMRRLRVRWPMRRRLLQANSSTTTPAGTNDWPTTGMGFR